MQLLKKDWLKNLQKNKYLQLLPDFKEEKNKRFITLALTLFALCFFGLFAIGPTLSTISKLQKELKDNQKIEDQLKQKINNLSILQDKYANLQGDLPDVYAAVPKTPETAVLMGQIEALARNSGVNITSAQTLQVEAVSESKTTKKNSSFNFSIAIEGDYANIAKFINSLTNMQRIVSLDVITINNVTSRQKGNILKLSIKGTAYFKS